MWDRVASFEGVNDELGPFLRMTAPSGTSIDPGSVPLGEPWFRSWILLLGVLPVDFDHLCVVELEPGRRFLERSTMLSASAWEHERVLEPLPGGGTRVVDRLAFTPRVGVLAPLQAALYAAVFAWRHHRLRRAFGVRRPAA